MKTTLRVPSSPPTQRVPFPPARVLRLCLLAATLPVAALPVAALLAGALLSGPVLASPAARLGYESQVVSMDVTIQEYEPWRPWEKKTPATRTVMAVVVEGQGLVTTADNIQGATIISVQKHGRPVRDAARVVKADQDANIALLTVDKPGYFDDLKPVTLAATVPTEGEVHTVRWHEGQLEVAAGRIVSVEVGSAYMGALRHASLLVETDLSNGGWSEPLFANGQLIGLTYSQDGQRATVTPIEIVRGCLAALRAASGSAGPGASSGAQPSSGPGPSTGFANFSLRWQDNNDPVQARALSQTGEPSGIIVTQVPWGSSACGALYPGDILLSLDGHAIDATGNYEHPNYGQVEFTQIVVDGHKAGDVIPAKVLRAGREVPVKITLRPARAAQDLLPIRSGGEPPPYAIEGGLVFRELDGDFLRGWGTDWDKRAPLLLTTRYTLFRTDQTPARRRVILLTYVLPSSYTIGYGDLETIPVAEVNGRAIDSIDDIVEAFRHPEGGFHRVVFEPNFARTEIVLDAARHEAATTEILTRYRIPQRSRLRAEPLVDLGKACPARP